MALWNRKKNESVKPDTITELMPMEESSADASEVIRVAPEDVEIVEADVEETVPASTEEAPAESEVSPEPSMTKEERKNNRKELKAITGRLRIRSFGVDFLALAGAAACVLLAIFFGYPKIGAAAGLGSAVLAALIMVFSQIPASHELRKKGGDPEMQQVYRKRVWLIGIRTIRLLVILAAAEMALVFVMYTVSRQVTWQRWAIYAGEFAILAMILLRIVHPFVRSYAVARGILDETEEEKMRRKIRRGSAVIFRILGIVLLTAAVFGQIMFQRIPWTAFESGTVCNDFEEMRLLLEKVTEGTPAENEEYTNSKGEPVTRDEYCRREIVAPDGTVLYRYRHLNTDIARVDADMDPDGQTALRFVVYSVEEQEDGWQKVEAANILWFGAYAVLILICYGLYCSRAKRKLKKYEERMEQ